MLKVWGRRSSFNVQKVLWLVSELGLAHEHIPAGGDFGRLDEPSWQRAPKSSAFVDIVTGEPAWFDTRVALLWDDRYLYFRVLGGRDRRLGHADRARFENL